MNDLRVSVISVLESLNPGYVNKKEVTEEANKYLASPLSYSSWKHLWQRDVNINEAIEYLLIKNANRQAQVAQPTNKFNWANSPVDDTDYNDYLSNVPLIHGARALDQVPDPFATYQKMCQYYEKADKLQSLKAKQTITFTGGPICLVNIADIHFGGAVDVKRVFEDIEIINSTPRMYINFLGDLSNNFIGSWTRKINHNSGFSIEEEQAISRYYIQQVSKRLIAFTSGNHDLWSAHESGIDMMKSYLNETGSSAVYDAHENVFNLIVDGMNSVVRTRHQWLGSSQYNDTHAIEKAAKFDQAVPFDIGVGAHTHRSGLYREFNNGGKTGVAILCGTYKRFDEYAREVGFPQSNKSTSVCMIIDPDSESGYHGVSDIQTAAKYMKFLTQQCK